MIKEPMPCTVLYLGGARGGVHSVPIIAVDWDCTPRNFVVDAKDVTHLIPGFIAGAPYAIFPISKVLKRIRFYWKLKHFKKIGDNLWRYTFEVPGFNSTISMDVSNGETNKS